LIDDAFVFVKVCKLLQKHTHDNTAMRCVAIDWLIDDAFVFVKGRKLYTKHTHAMTPRRCDALLSVG
jgi:hypothetical protein